MSEHGVPDSGRLAGVVSVRELAAAGLSDARIRTLVRRQVLVPVRRGVYARADAAAAAACRAKDQHALQVAAALAVAGPHAVVSHRSAALVHGLELLGQPAGIVTVTQSPADACGHAAWPGTRLHIAALPAEHVTTLASGLRITTVARTVIDLARASSLRAGVVTADSALRSGQTSLRELQVVLAGCARWPGIRRAREVTGFSDGRSESVLESLARVVFREQRLPPPELQVWVGGDDMVVGRADFLWRRYRTIGEADGALKYGGPAGAIAQLQRDARLREAGFEVVHFTWSQIIRVPHQVAASLRAAFQRGQRAAAAG